MNKANKLIDIHTTGIEADHILRSLITTQMNNEFRKSFEYKLKNQASHVKPTKQVKEHRIGQRSKGNPLLIWGAIAASLLLLVFFNLPTANDSGTSIAMNYLSTSDMVHPGISRSIALVNQNRASAIAAFNDGQYNEAALLLSAIDNKTDEDNFYLGVSYLKNEDYQKAIAILNESMTVDVYQSESRYYLIIAYVLNDEHSKGIELANAMSVGDYKYQEIQTLMQSIR